MNLPLLGRIDAGSILGGVHAFGVLSPDGRPRTLAQPTDVVRQHERTWQCEHLWLVSSVVDEVLRFSPESPVSPLTSSELQRSPRRTPRSVLRLRITPHDASGSATYTLDLGQSLYLYADRLHVELLAPPGAIQVGVVGQRPTAQGLVFDALANVRIARVEAPLSSNRATYTQHVVLAGPASPLVLPVPSAARRLTVYPSQAGVAMPTMRWFLGDARPAPDGIGSGAIEVGVVDWDAPPRHRPRMEIDAPAATHLAIERAPDGPELVTLVWEIQP